jgi:hypothetical protein
MTDVANSLIYIGCPDVLWLEWHEPEDSGVFPDIVGSKQPRISTQLCRDERR